MKRRREIAETSKAYARKMAGRRKEAGQDHGGMPIPMQVRSGIAQATTG
jgi:hypothetical protein